MCGRYALSRPANRYADFFDADLSVSESLESNYNVAPTDPVYAVFEGDEQRHMDVMRWGLVPFWSDSPKDGARRINARAETVATKPMFRDAFEKRRCLLPADGFYEWITNDDGTKQPFYIFASNHAPLALAGIWERWKDPAGNPLITCSVITTNANRTLEPIHNRMPVIVGSDDWEDWLDPSNRDSSQLTSFLRPADDDLLEAIKVARTVNNVRNKGPECLLAPEDVPGEARLFDV